VTSAPAEATAGQQAWLVTQDPQEREQALVGIKPLYPAAWPSIGRAEIKPILRRPSGVVRRSCSFQGPGLKPDTGAANQRFPQAAGRGLTDRLPTAAPKRMSHAPLADADQVGPPGEHQGLNAMVRARSRSARWLARRRTG